PLTHDSPRLVVLADRLCLTNQIASGHPLFLAKTATILATDRALFVHPHATLHPVALRIFGTHRGIKHHRRWFCLAHLATKKLRPEHQTQSACSLGVDGSAG